MLHRLHDRRPAVAAALTYIASAALGEVSRYRLAHCVTHCSCVTLEQLVAGSSACGIPLALACGMLRYLLVSLVVFTGCNLEDQEISTHLDGNTTNHLAIEATADLSLCNAAPCTLVKLTLRQGDTAAANATVLVSADGGPAVTATFKPNVGSDNPNSGEFTAVFDHWIGGIRIDATSGNDTAALWSDAGLSTPYEASIALPDQIAVGEKTALHWDGQGRPVFIAIVYASDVPAVRFGFLTTYTPDTGSYEFGPSIFTDAGTYTISLNRWLDLSNSDHSLTWRSSWQKKVIVVPALPM